MHRLEGRVAIVALPERPEHATVILTVARILRIHHPGVDRTVVRPLPLFTDHLTIPVRNIVTVIIGRTVGHDGQNNRLPSLLRRFERSVDDIPAILPLLRLDESPVESEVGDGGVWVVNIDRVAP